DRRQTRLGRPIGLKIEGFLSRVQYVRAGQQLRARETAATAEQTRNRLLRERRTPGVRIGISGQTRPTLFVKNIASISAFVAGSLVEREHLRRRAADPAVLQPGSGKIFPP